MAKSRAELDVVVLCEQAKRAETERMACRAEAYRLTKEIARLYAARYRVPNGKIEPPHTVEIDALKLQRDKVWERVNYLSKVIIRARQAQRYSKNAAHPAPHAQTVPEPKPAELLTPEDEVLLDEVIG